MKRFLLFTLIIGISGLNFQQVSYASDGLGCKKVGLTKIVGEKKFTCVKLNSKLMWNSGFYILPNDLKTYQKISSDNYAATGTDIGSQQLVQCNQGSPIIYRLNQINYSNISLPITDGYLTSIGISGIKNNVSGCSSNSITIKFFGNDKNNPLNLNSSENQIKVMIEKGEIYTNTYGVKLFTNGDDSFLAFLKTNLGNPVLKLNEIKSVEITSSEIPPEVIGPGGGVIFYNSKEGFTCGEKLQLTCHNLERAPANWADIPRGLFQIPTYPSAISLPKNLSNSFIPDGTSTDIGSGLKNTLAIINQGNDRTTAAGAAHAYKGGGYSDWYLPSRDELNKIFQYSTKTFNFQSLDPNYVGLMTNCAISSSEAFNQANFMWGQFMGDGAILGYSKTTSCIVRPIRAF